MWNWLKTFLHAPEFADEDKTRRAHALNAAHIIMGVAVVVLGLVGVLFISPEKVITTIIVIASVFLIAVGMWFNRRGRVTTSALILLAHLWGATILLMSLSGGIRSLDITFFVSGTVIAGIILGARGSLIYAGLSLLTGLLFILMAEAGIVFANLFTFPPVSAWIILFINLILTVVPLQVALQTLSKTAKRALASEERYRLIASVMSDYVFSVTYDEKGQIQDQWLSGAFEAITGYTPEEYFARGGWVSLVHPDDQAIDAQDMAQLRANQKVTTQLRIMRKDGAIRWVRGYGHPKWDEQANRLVGIYGAVQDISEQKGVETSLRQREVILEVVADAANTFLKIPEWNDEVWSTEVNRLLERLGTTIKATHAYLFENHLLEDGSPGLSMRYEWTASGFVSDLGNPAYINMRFGQDEFDSWASQIPQGLPYIGDTQHLSNQDVENLSLRGIHALLDVPIHIDGVWWGTIGFDEMSHPRQWSNAEVGALVTAASLLAATIKRRQTDVLLQGELQQRKLLIDELEARNAELDRFNYTVSHDLKTPLVTIKGFLGFLEKDAAAGNIERLREDTQRIANAVDKMNSLLHDLLELSRIGRVSYTPDAVPFAHIVREALELTHGRLAQCGVTIQVQPHLPIVYGDKPRLVEVLQNLLDNAAKYMGDQPNPIIEIGQSGQENEQIIFYLRDNGIGIAPEYYERIFGLFNKLDALSEGTGVGLTLVKRIIEVHGGRIWVESEAGQGSIFYFTLPTAKQGD